VRTDGVQLLPFGRLVVPVELIFSSSWSTLFVALFFPGNFLNKRRELQFFSLRENLNQRVIAFTDLFHTIERFVNCHPVDGAKLIKINHDFMLRMK